MIFFEIQDFDKKKLGATAPKHERKRKQKTPKGRLSQFQCERHRCRDDSHL